MFYAIPLNRSFFLKINKQFPPKSGNAILFMITCKLWPNLKPGI